ncbi:ATP-dependent DNA ligase [Rathayibacter tanaceti]|uniref:DNA ligase (ATP) n=2 Tax=Rathayibacter tanaceti TaxID=1671680 RepID=A0A166H6D7_9MICO|nr:ATP-dependent DNA ligase [Rathayibacter tanaceti]KZX20025.1 putative DNA ligase-like protein/MT0965 [Rathayibacter tanaceti]QHC55250.1 ATP-dependent DNA ligase [Rathayibacter tanaceti]TCO36455.1 ATP-dependent DNA ligase [Rathayibacter tanaceti]
MDLPFALPLAPMLAKAVAAVPAQDAVAGGYSYEPKWDGFRAIVSVAGGECRIGSRGSKPLTRYFPELVEAFLRLLPDGCVLDGEIVVATGAPGAQRLDWELLSQRIHPAASRVAVLAETTPAMLVAFDLLALDGRSLLEEPYSARREALAALLTGLPHPLHLGRTTADDALARDWLERFEGAGLDGVVAKPLAAPYAPGKRTMLKVKHHRTAEVVAIGYREHTSQPGVGSILLGLYGDDGELRQVGGASAFSDERRVRLVEELTEAVERDDAGDAVRGDGERSRFSAGRDRSFVRLRPERVLEVRYDQREGARFRHTVQFERWRPDRDARSCTLEQLEQPTAYDLGDVLG